MTGLIRAAAFCAALALGLASAGAADKAFKRDDLADSAIKLEAQIKSEAGPVAKIGCDPADRRRCRLQAQRFPHRLADPRPDRRHRAGGQRQLAAAGPDHLPDPPGEFERADLPAGARLDCRLHRLSARRQAGEEADALAVLGRALADRKLWRPALDALRLSLELREVAEVRGQYEKMRDEHGFRLLDYTVDSDGATPRACFQFSEELPSASISRPSWRWPAPTSRR